MSENKNTKPKPSATKQSELKGGTPPSDQPKDSSKRDFLTLTASTVACVGGAVALVPFVKSMSPDAGELALGSTEVDISKVEVGQTITVMWRGTPVFVKRRTKQEVEDARIVDFKELRDPEADEDRVLKGKDEWLVTVAVCTHLGCVPLSNKGEYNGWFCPCHGSHYDTSGRIRKGPAPKNLPVPEYTFLDESTIKIG